MLKSRKQLNRRYKNVGDFIVMMQWSLPLFCVMRNALSVNYGDAWLRVKRGSGGLGGIPPTSKPPPRYREALLAKMKNLVAIADF